MRPTPSYRTARTAEERLGSLAPEVTPIPAFWSALASQTQNAVPKTAATTGFSESKANEGLSKLQLPMTRAKPKQLRASKPRRVARYSSPSQAELWKFYFERANAPQTARPHTARPAAINKMRQAIGQLTERCARSGSQPVFSSTVVSDPSMTIHLRRPSHSWKTFSYSQPFDQPTPTTSLPTHRKTHDRRAAHIRIKLREVFREWRLAATARRTLHNSFVSTFAVRLVGTGIGCVRC